MLTLARNGTGKSPSKALSVPRLSQLVLNGLAMDSTTFRASLQRPTNSILPEAWHQDGVHATLPSKIKTSNRPQDFSAFQASVFSTRLNRRETLASSSPFFQSCRAA
ncbi:hypothetical protein BASA81_010550 [Batrachochytrium salamandrivorans]|nr:hypothetical protein BASA81_010550 [Batrachochytrium salamandrivorans]